MPSLEEKYEERKLKAVKEIIKENFEYGKCGIFNCSNILGDTMTPLYEEGGLTVRICYGDAYFEVIGLNDASFNKLADYYEGLVKQEAEKERPKSKSDIERE